MAYSDIENKVNPSKIIFMVKKREGMVVEFVKEKITNAIFKAAQAVGGSNKELADELTDKVITLLEYKYDNKNIPTVEDVQDIVEKVLIKSGHAKTAKAYILYRQQREKIRISKGVFLEVKNAMDEYIDKTDWRVYENSNSEYSFSGLMQHTSGKIIANYTLNEIYPKEVGNVHRNGDLHIHDLSYGVVAYCEIIGPVKGYRFFAGAALYDVVGDYDQLPASSSGNTA